MTPIADGLGRLVRSPTNVDAENVAEQLGRVAPLIVLELPALAGGEDGNYTIPVLGFELLRALDENEPHRSIRVDVLDQTVDVKHAGTRARTSRQ